MTSNCVLTSFTIIALQGVIAQNTEVIQNPHPSGQNLDTNSLPCPLLGRTWGRWGKTLIGALVATSLRSVCYSLGPSDLLKRVETLDSVSNYYVLQQPKFLFVDTPAIIMIIISWVPNSLSVL